MNKKLFALPLACLTLVACGKDKARPQVDFSNDETMAAYVQKIADGVLKSYQDLTDGFSATVDLSIDNVEIELPIFPGEVQPVISIEDLGLKLTLAAEHLDAYTFDADAYEAWMDDDVPFPEDYVPAFNDGENSLGIELAVEDLRGDVTITLGNITANVDVKDVDAYVYFVDGDLFLDLSDAELKEVIYTVEDIYSIVGYLNFGEIAIEEYDLIDAIFNKIYFENLVGMLFAPEYFNEDYDFGSCSPEEIADEKAWAFENYQEIMSNILYTVDQILNLFPEEYIEEINTEIAGLIGEYLPMLISEEMGLKDFFSFYEVGAKGYEVQFGSDNLSSLLDMLLAAESEGEEPEMSYADFFKTFEGNVTVKSDAEGRIAELSEYLSVETEPATEENPGLGLNLNLNQSLKISIDYDANELDLPDFTEYEDFVDFLYGMIG